MSRARLAVPVLLAWTFFLWLSRIRNVVGNDDLSASGEAWRMAVAGLFLVLAGAALWARRGRDEEPRRARLALQILCAWTIAFWVVRGVGIIVDDHPLGFTLVHTVLMAISIGAAGWAWPPTPAPVTAPDGVV